MSDARPIGEIFRKIVARTERMMAFQALLNACDAAADRKTLIMEAREQGMIEGSDAELLIQVYQLETA